MGTVQKQAEKFGAEIDEFDTIQKVSLKGSSKIVETEEHMYDTQAVIIASGMNRRRLPLPEGEKMVKVYSINECPWCERVKKYLKSRNVDFEVHNIEENEADRDACCKLTGDTMVAITTVNDKDYVLGFDKAGIDALLR